MCERSGLRGPILILTFSIVLAAVAATSAVAQGGDPNACDAEGDYPDVIVGSLHQKQRYGTIGGITAFSIGTTSCNIGTCWLNWFDFNNQHPVIGQNMFRLKDGRFEHIGQSWLKHGFFALSGDLCSDDCVGTNGDHLGVNCSDPYSSQLNGNQTNLGPKFEVNAGTGFHPHPVTDISLSGDAIFKRLQVHNSDLDPLLNHGALYFVEGQYVAEDDAAAERDSNNASYRRVDVTGSAPNFDFSFAGSTQQQQAGIRAWADFESGVEEVDVEIADDGLMILASKVTDLGGGTWHYEYALHNLTSHRSAGSFSVPIPDGATVTNIDFHDVDYHSGEPFDDKDWTDNGAAGFEVSWATEAFTSNPNANALRWGTLYNFRFDADVPPGEHPVTIGLYRPGSPSEISVFAQTPSLCDGDSVCDPGEDVCNCSDCGTSPSTEGVCDDGVDDDCDLLTDCADPDCCAEEVCALPDVDADSFIGCNDCDDNDGTVWQAPGEVSGLMVSVDAGDIVLSWDPPADPGGTSVQYEVLRARSPDDFVTFTSCLSAPDPSDTALIDNSVPVGMFAYLVRALNDCPQGVGPLGSDSAGAARAGRSCP